jgi:glucokinase
VLESAGLALGSSVAWLVNLLDPEAVIVGGGLGLAEGPYWDSFARALPAHIWADSSRNLPVLKARLGLDTGIIGAALSSTLAIRATKRDEHATLGSDPAASKG